MTAVTASLAERERVSSSTALSDFTFASGHWCLSAEGGTPLAPVFADDPRAVARAVMARLSDAVHATGRSHIVYGMVPFDTGQPAQLRLTDNARSAPRDHAALSTPRPGRIVVPDSPQYRQAVAHALREIDEGTVQKVVLARTMRADLPAAHTPDHLVRDILELLAAANPRADVFHLRQPDGSTWLGASPEIVADVHRRTLVTHPLAGSRPRHPDQSAPDVEFVDAIKDRNEHALVVQHIRGVLNEMTESIQVPAAPTVFATDRMWHLGTRITGHLLPRVSALEVAVALHPTPAVCGTPTGAAAALIRKLEGASRGFYSGLVGWTDASGDGRWSLVLRSGHLSERTLTLYAGAGIVAGSVPEAEHAETAAKFATMLAAVEGLR